MNRDSVTVEVLTTVASLEQIAEPWERLRLRCPRATPFQSPAWAIPWWRAFGRGELTVLALRAGERLVGLVPVFLRPQPGNEQRQLLLLGTGNTDYLDVLCEDGYEAQLADAMAVHLAMLDQQVREADFFQLPLSSPLLRVAAGWRAERLEGETCVVLPLQHHGGELDTVLPVRFAARLRQYRRRLARAGGVCVESSTGVPLAQVETLFESVVRLHAATWGSRGQVGVLAEPVVQQFHREVIRAAHALGLLDLYGLRLDGRMVAGYYGFRDDRCAYYYLGGFDPSAGALSVGSLIIGIALEAAQRRGALTFDFLRGREPYKYRWGAQDRPTARLRLVA